MRKVPPPTEREEPRDGDRIEWPLIRHRGFPKKLVCLSCGKLRVAASPADRCHPACRRPDTRIGFWD